MLTPRGETSSLLQQARLLPNALAKPEGWAERGFRRTRGWSVEEKGAELAEDAQKVLPSAQ